MKRLYRLLTVLFLASLLNDVVYGRTSVGIATETSIQPFYFPANSFRDTFDLLDNVRDEFKSEITKEIKNVTGWLFAMKDIEVLMEADYTIEKVFDGSSANLRITAPGAKIKWRIGGACSGIRPKVVITYDNVVITTNATSDGEIDTNIVLTNLDSELTSGINACGWLTLPILIVDGFGFDTVEDWISQTFKKKIKKKIAKKLGISDPINQAAGGELVLNALKSIPIGHGIFDDLGGKQAVVDYLTGAIASAKVTLEFDEDGVSRAETVDDKLNIIIEQ